MTERMGMMMTIYIYWVRYWVKDFMWFILFNVYGSFWGRYVFNYYVKDEKIMFWTFSDFFSWEMVEFGFEFWKVDVRFYVFIYFVLWCRDI